MREKKKKRRGEATAKIRQKRRREEVIGHVKMRTESTRDETQGGEGRPCKEKS